MLWAAEIKFGFISFLSSRVTCSEPCVRTGIHDWYADWYACQIRGSQIFPGGLTQLELPKRNDVLLEGWLKHSRFGESSEDRHHDE